MNRDGADDLVRSSSPDETTTVLVDWLTDLLREAAGPVYVALDGRSGAGKSTLAEAAKKRLAAVDVEVAVIDGDQFYGGGSADQWDRRSVAEKVAHVIDWRRQHNVLGDLRRDGIARWHPFDWSAEDWDADEARLASEVIETVTAPIVLLEGAYSCRPELHDVIDRTVLLQAPAEVRRDRLLEREGDDYRDDWEARWSSAEDHYFATIMPPQRFDLILGTTS